MTDKELLLAELNGMIRQIEQWKIDLAGKPEGRGYEKALNLYRRIVAELGKGMQ
jgi:hypothetical protein